MIVVLTYAIRIIDHVNEENKLLNTITINIIEEILLSENSIK